MSASDKPVKEGQLHIKQNKFGKKWKRSYALLYPDSPFGVARLEFYDWKDGTLAGEKFHTRKAADRKVVRLAECIRVVSAPAETGHKENMAAFIIETSDKTMLLSAEPAMCDEWVQRLSEVAFSGNSSDGKCSNDSADSAFLEMAVNSIYLSREEVSEFWVTAQRTEAAERCSLRGSYILRAESDCLILKDATTKENLYSWPYKLLRRYGRDRVMFSFEAGRRCASGPGNFTFETSQGHEIFQKVESSIRAQQGSENRLSCPSLETDAPTDITSQSASDPGRYESHQPLSLARKEAEEKTLKGRVLPNLPAVKTSQPQHLLDAPMSTKSNTPPRSPVHHHPADSEHMAVYSEPKDSVKGVKTHFDPLYSDPVDIVRGKEVRPEKDSVISPLYSDLYERVSYEVVGGNVSSKAMSISGPPPGGEEHIYDEPEGVVQTSDPPQLYSEVRMEAAAWRKQSNDDKLGYEYPYNPDTDDYSVPNFQAQRNQVRNKTGPKPVPAPKPQVVNLTKPSGKEREPEKMQSPSAHSNSNNNNNVEALYSQVLKPGIGKNPKPHSPPPQPVITQDPSLPPLTTANQTQSTPPLLTANQTQSAPPLPPMNKYLGPPPLPPANKPQSIPPQPPSSKPQSVPPPPPAKPQSAKTQPLPIPQTSKTLPSLPVPGKLQNVVVSSLAESHLASDNGIVVSSGLQRDGSVIYEDMGIL
ncbi:docking protein 1 isoform X2 [Hyperolius riggenbachi]|uniref:docking protein 1 isoform X2 n=1 Tax=Hyperolius riggenbachi TaxID=752182 RepID=UPI0035A28964